MTTFSVIPAGVGGDPSERLKKYWRVRKGWGIGVNWPSRIL